MSNPTARLSVQLPAANELGVSDPALVYGAVSGDHGCGSSMTASFPGRTRFFPTNEEEPDRKVTKIS